MHGYRIRSHFFFFFGGVNSGAVGSGQIDLLAICNWFSVELCLFLTFFISFFFFDHREQIVTLAAGRIINMHSTCAGEKK